MKFRQLLNVEIFRYVKFLYFVQEDKIQCFVKVSLFSNLLLQSVPGYPVYHPTNVIPIVHA